DRVAPLRERVLTAFVEVALEHDDLALARLQTESIRDDALRADFTARIDREERNRRREQRQRRMLVAVVAGLIVSSGLFTWRYISSQRASQFELRDTLTTVEQQRNMAWEMMDFMLVDLRAD